MEFNVKIWKKFQWKKRVLIIRENDFQLKKVFKPQKKKKQKEDEIHTYSLTDALILDHTKNNDLLLLIASKDYKHSIKPANPDDKSRIIQTIENIITKFTVQNVYKDYNDKIAQFNDSGSEMNPQDFICCKFFLFKNLMNDLNQKIEDLKNEIKKKLKSKSENEFMRLYNSMNTIKVEMDKQFEIILTYMNKYFDINEDFRKVSVRLKSLSAEIEDEQKEGNKKNKKEEERKSIRDIDSSSDEEQNGRNTIDKIKNEIIDNNQNNNNNEINNNNDNNNNKGFKFNFNFEYGFLSHNSTDFKNELYNFNKRKKYKKSITYPQNIIKEMITAMTQNKPAPVYFNEPLSMGQKQCEKFYYLNLLKKVSQEKNKPLQLGYISAFIIGEIFLGLNRNLKPFNPIIGETYEYFDNENNFRYYSEQVSHNPQITAFIGETPDFALYGDTKNSTSFKILKGAMELNFMNKVHLHIKSTNDHFVYNRPNVMAKGFLKPPLHSDYSGTTVIENQLFPEYKAEIKFIEESWTNSTLGLIEGKITCEDKTLYSIKGNWNNNIYLVDSNDKNKKIDLLTIDQNQDYLKNSEGNYELPSICYNLNYMDNNLEKSLPGNDSRFRQDMRLLEEAPDTKEAQVYKEKYEEKQRKELNNENHKVLFFDEKFDKESGENYFVPNGKYWEMKKKGELKNNSNSTIFDVSKY